MAQQMQILLVCFGRDCLRSVATVNFELIINRDDPRPLLFFQRSGARPVADVDDDALGTFKFFFIG